jgi:hypothetical protein
MLPNLMSESSTLEALLVEYIFAGNWPILLR